MLHLQKEFPNYQIDGSDLSTEAIKLAKRNMMHSHFFAMNLDRKAPAQYKEHYQTLVCSEVLEHVQDVSASVGTLNELLKKRGFLILTVPYLMKNWTAHDDFSGHFRRFERNELEAILIRHGFTIVERFSWGAYVYELYYRLIELVGPRALMKKNSAGRTPRYKQLIGKILTEVFTLEYYLRDRTCKRGRRLFIVARKKS